MIAAATGQALKGIAALKSLSAPAQLTRLAAVLRQGPAMQADAIGSAPVCGGAYVLAMRLHNPVELCFRRSDRVLDAGFYVYSGSAYGPGGIRARLTRHVRREKKLHWHVDWLTAAADSIHAIALPGGSECEIVSRLMQSGWFRFPLAGFGSSDCARCPSHLLEWRSDGAAIEGRSR